MSNQFVGLTMLVTLKSPPGAQLRGTVQSVEAGKSLTLRHVTCPANGKYVREFTIIATDIDELVEATNENAQPPKPVTIKQMNLPARLADPAILSVGKRPLPVLPEHMPQQWSKMERADSTRTVTSKDDRSVKEPYKQPEDGLVEPIQQLHIVEVEADVVPEVVVEESEADLGVSPEQPVSKSAKKVRKRKNNREQRAEGSLLEPNATLVIKTKETARSQGWRQTPLLEPSFQPFATLKKKGRNGRREIQNGWGTEDATDVQDMGEFDFADNLAKFDKKSVFNQLQAEDGTADEDRLVSHNRLSKAKPGTGGGKNLAYNENVLDSPSGTPKARIEVWNSEASDVERISQRDTGSGRASRRAESKLPSDRRAQSRKGSATHPTVRSQSFPIPATSSKPSFFLVPSNQLCEPISALQMINLETIADNDLGLSEDVMAENAARGIAEVALSALNTTGAGLIQVKRNVIPTVVVYAGNNKSGLRAVAAGRHLRNHGLNVVVCVLGLERESELLVGLRRQLKVFRSFGGKLVSQVELLLYVKTLNAPIELIIDGLLGLTMSFEELRTGDQSTAYELIEFANRSKASVLAIDVPTGIDPTTGKVSIIDGRQLYIHAKYVVAMGAPKKGLLEAMTLGEGVGDDESVGQGSEWQLFVADIGLGVAVWKKAGTRVRRGVEFEGTWVLGMRFQGGNAE